MNQELGKQAGESLVKAQEPTGIRWVAAYTVLIITGYGQYGLGFLFKGSETIMGVAFTSLALLFAVAAYGLLVRKLWAFKLMNPLFTALMYFEMYRLAKGIVSHDTLLADVFVQVQAIGFALWILVYLKKDRVKAWFKGDSTEQNLSKHKQMQKEVASVWKRGIAAMLLPTAAVLLVVASWVSGKISPIPELADMKVTEGVLTKVTNGSSRGAIPFLILKEDFGTVSGFGVVRSQIYHPFVGQRVKVWSAEYCALFGMSCFESAYQVEYISTFFPYNSKLILDYKDVRENMEKMRFEVSNFDYVFGAFALAFALVGYWFFVLTKRELKKIENKYGSIVKEQNE